MKYLFLLLMLANVVVFVAWMRLPAPDPVPGTPPERVLTADVIELEPVEDGSRATAQAGEQALVEAGQSCLRLGPFYSSAALDPAKNWASSAGLEYLQVPGEERFKVGDWVYLPPFETRDQAVARAQELRDMGIDDIYVVASDEFRNAIALGLYSTERGAAQRLAFLAEMGVEAQVHERMRTREIVDLYMWGNQSPDSGDLPEYIEDEGATLEPVACERIEALHKQAALGYNSELMLA